MAENAGFLKIRVTTAGGALPVEGAVINIFDNEGGGVIYSLRTDRGGNTETVALTATPAGNSLSPDGGVPDGLYNVTVAYQGYYPVEFAALPVFEGVTSTQTVDLEPISEEELIAGAYDGRVVINETPVNPSLGWGREDLGGNNGKVRGGNNNE